MGAIDELQRRLHSATEDFSVGGGGRKRKVRETPDAPVLASTWETAVRLAVGLVKLEGGVWVDYCSAVIVWPGGL